MATFDDYLDNVIGLNTADQINAVIAEGLDNFDVLADFEADEVKTLCATVRSPGGVVQIQGNNNNQVIRNPGHQIPTISETRIGLACYCAGIYRKIGRAINADSLSLTRLRCAKEHKVAVTNHPEQQDIPEVTKAYGIMKALDMLPMLLRQILGVSKIPLLYVIRQAEVPPALPALGVDVPWSDGHTNLFEDLIEYVPLTGASYAADNALVFQKLQGMVKDTSHASSLKPFQRTQDGRGAYFALQQHNMGESKWDRVIEQAEDMVLKRIWNGNNARYPLKNHVQKHREANNDMVRASQFIAYDPPNEHTRVNRLLKSIESKDSSVASAKTTILNDNTKRNDFEQAADFLLLAVPQKKTTQNTHTVSGLHSEGGNKHRGGGGGGGGGRKRGKGKIEIGKTGVELRYYKTSEFHKLPQNMKDELSEWRDNKKKAKKAQKQSETQKISALEAQLAEQAQVIASLRSAQSQPQVPPGNPPTSRALVPRNPLQPPTGFTQRFDANGNPI